MGWCHEFGPQITEGCDHPMLAGATSCTCQNCGAECKGKFAGCGDVWARGPRLVAVRASTLRRPEADVRPATGYGTIEAVDTSPAGGAERAGGMGDDALRALLDELVVRTEAFEVVATRVDSLVEAQAAPRPTPEDVAAIGRRLEDLASRLSPLQALPSRLEALEATSPPTRTPTHEELAALAREIDRLGGRLSPLERLAKEVRALDQERGRLASLDKVLAGLVQGGERLADRVETLETTPASEVGVPGSESDRAELTVLADRVAALESTPPVEPRVPAGLVKQMERLVSQVAALEGAPERLAALEKSGADLASAAGKMGPNQDLERVVIHLRRLTAELAPLRAVPKRVEAIERVQGRVNAIDKALATLTRRVEDLSGQVGAPTEDETTPRIDALDAALAEIVLSVGQLSSQVAGLQEVPKRVEALEQAASPSEKLVASIARRVDRLSTQAASVAELSPRVEALEQAAAGGGHGQETTELVSRIAAEVRALRTALDEVAPRLRALEQAGVPGEALDGAPDRIDTLARGLGHAIDMIDQLAHQVAVLEEVTPVALEE